MTALLKIDAVHARYGRKEVLSNVSFELPEGSITALLGPNGAGKSTLMRLVIGVHTVKRGSVTACGFDPMKKAREVRRLVGYVPDKPDAYPWMTPKELFSFLRPQYPTWSLERERSLALDLDVPLDQKFSKLSRGQATKAMLVAALAFEPRLLLLDEPFGPLDPGARDEIVRGVFSGLADDGCGVLVATHDLYMASRIADRVVMVEEGHVRKSGLVSDVLGLEEESGQIADRLKGLFTNDSIERMQLL